MIEEGTWPCDKGVAKRRLVFPQCLDKSGLIRSSWCIPPTDGPLLCLAISDKSTPPDNQTFVLYFHSSCSPEEYITLFLGVDLYGRI